MLGQIGRRRYPIVRRCHCGEAKLGSTSGDQTAKRLVGRVTSSSFVGRDDRLRRAGPSGQFTLRQPTPTSHRLEQRSWSHASKYIGLSMSEPTGSLPQAGAELLSHPSVSMTRMADLDRQRLVQVMALAASGVETAAVLLYQEFGLQVARSLRRHLGDFGVRDIDADDLHGLTMDACFVLYDHARSWSPTGGALPWIWADRRMRQLVSSHVGQWSDPIDEEHQALPAAPVAAPWSSDEPDELELLRVMAKSRRDVATYVDALDAAATSSRNKEVLVAYRLQASLGDRSPAVTIGRRFEMTPAAVRQVVKRTSDRLDAISSQAA